MMEAGGQLTAIHRSLSSAPILSVVIPAKPREARLKAGVGQDDNK
jgi:hypothetical protein